MLSTIWPGLTSHVPILSNELSLPWSFVVPACCHLWEQWLVFLTHGCHVQACLSLFGIFAVRKVCGRQQTSEEVSNKFYY